MKNEAPMAPPIPQVAAAPQPQVATFQKRVQPWMMETFGADISADKVERNDRFIEESLELVQSLGCTRDRAHALVDYVFNRPVGEPSQEVGGVMVTLAALCLTAGIDMHAAAETELARIWTEINVIREKQKSKPRGSAFPVPQPQITVTDEMCDRAYIGKWRGVPELIGHEPDDEDRQWSREWLEAWQSELGPALGMTAWREPTDSECYEMTCKYHHRADNVNPGRAMFAAVKEVLGGG